jgi:hypothetical protein
MSFFFEFLSETSEEKEEKICLSLNRTSALTKDTDEKKN